MQSFVDIEQCWLKDIRMNCSNKVKIYLVGNKSDLEQKREISTDIGNNLA